MAAPDPCAFCLGPLTANSIALSCGHAFHSVCTLQFLLKKKQCPVCRAPVDESQLVDVSEQPPEAAGRAFLPPSPTISVAGSGPKSGGGSSAGAGPVIELQAFAGSVPPAESAAAVAGYPGSRGQSPFSSPMPGDGQALGAAWQPHSYMPDYLSPSPRSQQGSPTLLGVVVDASTTPLAAATEPPSGTQPSVPSGLSIRVVRPNRWLRPMLLGFVFLILASLIIAMPIALSGSSSSDDGGGGNDGGGGGKPSEEDCWECWVAGDAAGCFGCDTACRGCDAYFRDWWKGLADERSERGDDGEEHD